MMNGIRREPLWWFVLLVIGIVLVVPIAITEVPPLLDYPNHLARLYILAFAPGDPVLSHMYARHWAIIPNIAFDVIIPPLLHFIPLYTAGRLIIALTVLVPLLGVIAYAHASFGRASWWQLGAALVAYHALILMGFLNFDFSIGLALLLAAAWISYRDRYPIPSVILGISAAIILFFFHVFSLAYYLLLIGSRELVLLVARWRTDKTGFAKIFITRSVALALVAMGPVLLSLMSPVTDAHPTIHFGKWSHKAQHFILPFVNYHWKWDFFTAFVIAGIAAFLFWRKRLIVAPHAAVCAGLIIAVYLVCPRDMMETAFVQDRWPIMVGLLLFAGAQTAPIGRNAGRAIFACFAVLFVVKMTIITAVWNRSNADIAGLRQAIAPVPAGAKVLLVLTGESDNPAYWNSMPLGRRVSHFCPTYYHTAALLVPERRAIFRNIFSSRFNQPIVVLPPYD